MPSKTDAAWASDFESGTVAPDPLERAVLRKVTLRLVPFLFLLYIANILDRTNVGFARLRMLSDLGLSETVYGIGAGIFYLGYIVFEIPSNLILHRVGARRWISRIMVTWGVISICTMFVTSASSFYLLRILLGVAEAGFFPGIILYLSYWFPARERAQAVACFMTASPLSGVVGGPLSGALLQYLDKAGGLAGWQWLFFLEGVPSVLLGVVTWFYLTDRPAEAHWLTPKERQWLTARLSADEDRRQALHGLSRFRALADKRVYLFILLYFTVAMGSNGFGFYAPTILQSHFPGRGSAQIGQLYAMPNLLAVIAMVFAGRHSDRTGERRWHLALAACLAGLGWGLSACLSSPWLVLSALALAQVGMMSMMGPFWSLATSFLSGTAAVGGIALINTLANVGGYLSPALVGQLKEATGGFAAGQIMLGLTMFLGGVIALWIRHDPAQPEK
jgi:ACS family tartrate transporter-like MFS transporter